MVMGRRVPLCPRLSFPFWLSEDIVSVVQRAGRNSDKTAHVGFDQPLWVPAHVWAPGSGSGEREPLFSRWPHSRVPTLRLHLGGMNRLNDPHPHPLIHLS